MARTLSWTNGGTDAAFGNAPNWNDITDGLNPALTAPSQTDTALFNIFNGVISGSGTVAMLEVGSTSSGLLHVSSGSTLVAGSLDVGVAASIDGEIDLIGTGASLLVTGDAIIGDGGTGVLNVLSGATLSTTNLTIGAQGSGSGHVLVSGAGSDIEISGVLNIGTPLGTGDLTIGAGATVNADVINIYGNVVLEGGLLDPPVTYVHKGISGGGNGTVGSTSGVIINEGTYQAGAAKPNQTLIVLGTMIGGGTLTINGTRQALSPVGTLAINSGDTLELDGPVLNAGSTTVIDTAGTTYTLLNSVIDVTFADDTGVIRLGDIAEFAGTIAVWQGGDNFIVTGGTLSNLAVVNGNTLTFSDSGTGAGAGGIDSIMFNGPVASTDFAIVNGNSVQVVSCFAAGTRIETETGPVAVETLAVGDRVVTVDGTSDPIIWIGSRTVNCHAHPRPETVWPVRVRAGAFRENVPERDLYLSPDHAVFVNGVLVPVKLLINGTTVEQVKRSEITYYHVELPRHAVILAEGLTVESYLDVGDKANYQHGSETVRLFPNFAAQLAPDATLVWETRGAAELVMAGARLEAARATLAGVETVAAGETRAA